MLPKFVLWRLDRLEEQLGASVDYLRHMANVSLPALFAFMKIKSLSTYRRKLPLEPYCVAGLVATQHEDCGTCVQIGVNQARKQGVTAELIRTVLDGRVDDLPDDLANVYRFTEAVVSNSGNDDEFRDAIRERYGEEALVELAIAIAACRVYPTTKRALGYAKGCALVKIEV